MKHLFNILCFSILLTFINVKVEAGPLSLLKKLDDIQVLMGVAKNSRHLHRLELDKSEPRKNDRLKCALKNLSSSQEEGVNKTIDKCEDGKFTWNKVASINHSFAKKILKPIF